MGKQRSKRFCKDKYCLSCGRKNKLTRDHIVPRAVARGIDFNIQCLCKRCNLSKGNLIIDFKSKTILVEDFYFLLPPKYLKQFLKIGHIDQQWVDSKGLGIKIERKLSIPFPSPAPIGPH